MPANVQTPTTDHPSFAQKLQNPIFSAVLCVSLRPLR
jgi:hypothetical protein